MDLPKLPIWMRLPFASALPALALAVLGVGPATAFDVRSIELAANGLKRAISARVAR